MEGEGMTKGRLLEVSQTDVIIMKHLIRCFEKNIQLRSSCGLWKGKYGLRSGVRGILPCVP